MEELWKTPLPPGKKLIALVDPKGEWTATVTSEGTVNLRRRYKESGSRTCEDFLRLGDLDDAIARLHAVRDFARAHFGEEWPKEGERT